MESKRSKITESQHGKITEIEQGKHILSNQAFTLIEVLVTVIIIGIISGITILSYHYVNNTNSLKCAKQLSVILDKTRMESMGMVKDSIILRIVKEDNSYCAITYRAEIEGGISKETEFDKVKIGSDSLSIFYTNAGSEKEITNENPLTIRFSKDSGSIKEAISEIKIVGRKTSMILLVKETGRNYLK
jgi:prepilin-type N-terminal cleavage/methylation domain-containing protein